MCEKKPTPDESYTNVLWLNKSTSNKEFARILNETFTKISLEEKSNIYFNDIVNKQANLEFEENIDMVYNKYFKPALKTKMSGNIVDFLNSLEQIADKYNSNGIKNYCMDLNNNIINFDIEEIDKLLNLFNTNYLLKKK